MRQLIPLLALLALPACAEPPATGETSVYRLSSINGAPFDAPATLQVDGAGQVSGNGPCNSYSGQLARPFPAFGAIEITATEIGCADLAAETSFFTALASMTVAQTGAFTLTLSNPSQDSMVFVQP